MSNKEERFKQIREHFGLSQTAFAALIDSSFPTVQKIEYGERKVGIQIQEKIIKNLPEINKDWFILGRGSMLSSTNSSMIAGEPMEAYEKSNKGIINHDGKKFVDATGAIGLYFDDMEFLLDLFQKKQTTWKPIVQQLVKTS